MQITVLHTEDCPNLAPLRERLDALLAGRKDVAVATHVVNSDAEAEQLGFHGSPTILIDGHDPFPLPAGAASLSCRLYDTGHGLRGFPTSAQLAAVLQAAD
jgi:hypothetical protein